MVDNLESLLGPDTCRLCLKTGRSPTPVSNENLEGSLMAIKIDILTSVKVAPSDKVCPMCRINVKNFYDFRIMCVQSDARIKGFAAKVASSNQEDLSVIKADQVVRSYKRVRRTGEADKPSIEHVKPIHGCAPVPGTVDFIKSTRDLFKSKAESGNYGGGLFKLKTKSIFMRAEEAFKGLKRPLILSGNPSTSTETGKLEVERQKSTTDPKKPEEEPFKRTEAPPTATEDSDPLMATNPLALPEDPLSSAKDPFLSNRSVVKTADTGTVLSADPLSPDEESNNITVEPLILVQEDVEEGLEGEKDSSPGGPTVKIENMLEDESISDTESNRDDKSDGENEEERGPESADKSDEENEEERDTQTAESDINKQISQRSKEDTEPISEPPVFPKIKEELPDYEEETANISTNEEPMEDLEIKPEEVIIPELKREPDDPDLFMETECDDEEDYSREAASFSEESNTQIKKEPQPKRDDTESLEVLVDPLMLMDEDHDAQLEGKLSRLSPVLGNGRNIKNGKLPLPPLNGARSDKQRGLEFVKQLLRQNDRAGEGAARAAAGAAAGGESVEKPYRCASCDISFAYYKSYMKHKDRHLGVQSTFACNHCTANYPSNRELHIHMRKHTERNFSCDRCYRSFPSKERLQAHYFLHTGDKPHVCDLCKKSFAYKSSFVFHMRKQHGEVITGGTYLRCPKCPTEWNTPSELKQHMEMHDSEETESTSFPCPICSMSFPSKSILNVHARIHQKTLK